MKKIPKRLNLSRETLSNLALHLVTAGTGSTAGPCGRLFHSTSNLPPCDTCTCTLTANCLSNFGSCQPCAN